MRKIGIRFLLLAVVFGIFFSIRFFGINTKIKSPIAQEKPFDRYTFENLRKSSFPASPIILGESLNQTVNYVSQMFYYKIDSPVGEKKVSGLLNIPVKQGIYPVIVMARGFVPVETYATGIGTQKAAEFFAQNGFITLAPDFLGYGQSDKSSQNSIEDRFQTYTTVLTLLSSLVNLNTGLDASYSGKIKADVSKIGIWGHSNGGQIAISTLEITGKNYPTVLWAPVSKSFPYSILYFTDEFDDHGKTLRKVVADFEKDYDIELYSPSNFYSWIQAPIQIHQGIADDAVPLKWSDNLVNDLRKSNKDVEYFTYPGADHNLMPNGWSEAVQRSVSFYKNHF
jgi:dienelactone hydrolase